MTWEDKWSIKPEVVFEGGNMAVDKSNLELEKDIKQIENKSKERAK